MPRKSSTTATPTKTRKTRTRKTSTTRTAKAVAKTDKVIKEVQAVLDKKPVAKVTKVKSLTRPSASRLITPSRYMQDIKQRWAIHNYEIKMLFSDFSKLNSYIRELEIRTVLGQFAK